MPYLVDTFALFEWYVDGNPAYRKYFLEMETEYSYTTHLTLLEFYHKLFHEAGKKVADEMVDIIQAYMKIVPMDIATIKRAAIFRSNGLNQKKKYSYADSINYVTAEQMHIPFLTGDMAFKTVPNVEWVGKSSK